MKIQLQCSGLDALWAFGQNEVDLEAEPATLQALLQELAEKTREKGGFFNPQSSTFHEEYEILVNGCALYTLPQGLSTELNDGDEVQIMVALGGG
jgi:molybdopterin converting factor small subunit